MENLIPLLLPAVVAFIVLKLLVKPMKWTFRAAIHGLGGFACLWLVNCTAVFTGLTLPVNAVTVLLAGTLGIPGLVLVTVLEVL